MLAKSSLDRTTFPGVMMASVPYVSAVVIGGFQKKVLGELGLVSPLLKIKPEIVTA